jgi:hypothetical protein
LRKPDADKGIADHGDTGMRQARIAEGLGKQDHCARRSGGGIEGIAPA